jgi:hypothetical protein
VYAPRPVQRVDPRDLLPRAARDTVIAGEAFEIVWDGA